MKIYRAHVLLDESSMFQVDKNTMLCISQDEFFEKGLSEVHQSALKGMMQKVSHIQG